LREQRHTLSFGEEEDMKIAFHLGKKKIRKWAFNRGRRRYKNKKFQNVLSYVFP